jgi:hypothetical protein
MDGWEPVVVAAVVAACSALVAAAMSVATARSARRSNERARFWERLSWALERIDESESRYDISWTVLDDLRTVPWADRNDTALAARLTRAWRARVASTNKGDTP